MCFLTNGGGVTEAHKAAELSDWLGVNIGADQVTREFVDVGSGITAFTAICEFGGGLRPGFAIRPKHCGN